MLYSQLGRTGLVVSRLAYGAMTFTMGNRSQPTLFKTDEEAAQAVIGKALGNVLAPHRQDVVIATEAGPRMAPALTRRELNRQHLLSSPTISARSIWC